MWRLAHCIYRAFRNTASHRCSQDVLIPVTTVCNKDDDDSKQRRSDFWQSLETKWDISNILKTNHFSFENVQKLQIYLKKFIEKQSNEKRNDRPSIESPKPAPLPIEPVQPIAPKTNSEETVSSLLQADENCMKTLQALSDFQDKTMSIIHLELALDALDAGNYSAGVESLQESVRIGKNTAALYNLGICYEQGLGVEQDRAKACDYYRQAAASGHIKAQLSLTRLSNRLDVHENDEEEEEEKKLNVATKTSPSTSRRHILRLSLFNNYQEDPSKIEHEFDLKTSTVACL